jgi:hypothetical protein
MSWNKIDDRESDERIEHESEDEEVVSYTLVPSNNKQIRYDGYGETRYSPDWFYAQYYKTERKINIKNMFYIVILIFILIFLITMSLIVLGEIFAISYPNTKFTKWWRQNIIYYEK